MLGKIQHGYGETSAQYGRRRQTNEIKIVSSRGIHLIICPSDKIEWGSTPFPTPSFVSLMLIDIID
jgi:hypothetical protein